MQDICLQRRNVSSNLCCFVDICEVFHEVKIVPHTGCSIAVCIFFWHMLSITRVFGAEFLALGFLSF